MKSQTWTVIMDITPESAEKDVKTIRKALEQALKDLDTDKLTKLDCDVSRNYKGDDTKRVQIYLSYHVFD